MRLIGVLEAQTIPVTLSDSEGSCRRQPLPRFFAEFILNVVKILRFAQDDNKRRAENDIPASIVL